MAHRYFESKDHAKLYQKYRPTPPKQLIDFIVNFLKDKYKATLSTAVDVGCGSGQGTFAYSPYFENVIGFDVSPNQIEEAQRVKNSSGNVKFQVSPAEKLNLPDGSVELVTASTAAHWFDLDNFFSEAFRILKPDGVLAIYTYSIPEFHWPQNPRKDKALNEIMQNFGVNGPVTKYMAPPGLMVLDRYKNLHIPSIFCDSIRNDETFVTEYHSTLADVCHETETWSAFQLLKEAEGQAAAQTILNKFKSDMLAVLGDEISGVPDPVEENVRLDVIWRFTLLIARKPSN